MSPLVVLGALGTLVSTITIVPHVIHAMRTKQPGGSPTAWILGVTGSTVWFLYGIEAGDFLVGAPGLVTIPCGLLLAIWSLRGRRDVGSERIEAVGAVDVVEEPAPAPAPVYVPDAWVAAEYPATDTAEVPEIPAVA